MYYCDHISSIFDKVVNNAVISLDEFANIFSIEMRDFPS